MIDWTLNIGHIYTLLAGLVTAIGIYFALRFDVKLTGIQLAQLGGRLINVENELKELTKLTVALAENNLKLTNVQSQLLELSHRITQIDEHGTRYMHTVRDRVMRLEGERDK